MNQLRIWDNSVIQKEYRQNYFSVNPNGKKRNMKNDQEFLVQKPKPSYHSKPVSKETVLKLILGQYLHSLPLRSDTFLFNHPSPASVTWLREIFTFFFFVNWTFLCCSVFWMSSLISAITLKLNNT